MSVLNATKRYFQMNKTVNFILCMFYHTQKIVHKSHQTNNQQIPEKQLQQTPGRGSI